MNPRAAWPAAFALAAVLPGCGGPTTGPTTGRTAPDRPEGPAASLLVVTVSSLRADHLGIYGYPRNTTPRLDLLGASGALFLEALTPWPETARAALAALSGADPAEAALGAPARLASGEVGGRLLPALLRARGYRTLAAVDHPALVGLFGPTRPFDRRLDFWERPGAAAADAVAGFAEEVLSGPEAADPFFLWLHFSAPEPPLAPGEEDLAEVAADGAGTDSPVFRDGAVPAAAFPGGPGYREQADRYDAAVRSVDRAVGRVLDALAGGPAAGKALVVVAGLHGESLGEHGPPFARPRGLFHEWLRVPLLFAWPGADEPPFPSGARFPGLVSLADLAPTALALLGAAPPPRRPEDLGISLAEALLRNQPRPHFRLHAASEGGLFAIYDGRLKMLRLPGSGGQPPLFAAFDLRRDPNEAENRYYGAEASLAPLKAELDTRRIRAVAFRQRNERAAAESGDPNGAGGPELPPALREALAARGYR